MFTGIFGQCDQRAWDICIGHFTDPFLTGLFAVGIFFLIHNFFLFFRFTHALHFVILIHRHFLTLKCLTTHLFIGRGEQLKDGRQAESGHGFSSAWLIGGLY